MYSVSEWFSMWDPDIGHCVLVVLPMHDPDTGHLVAAALLGKEIMGS